MKRINKVVKCISKGLKSLGFNEYGKHDALNLFSRKASKMIVISGFGDNEEKLFEVDKSSSSLDDIKSKIFNIELLQFKQGHSLRFLIV